MKRVLISDCYNDARSILAEANKATEADKIKELRTKAQDKADEGLVFLAENVQKNNLKDNDIIEGVAVRLWYDRFWLFLELNGLMLDKDEDHKPEDNYFWDKMAGVELDG